ncbi:MAG: hypothetical protein ACI81V_000966 [Lentimonas sp.]|jgi:hypothetical protein
MSRVEPLGKSITKRIVSRMLLAGSVIFFVSAVLVHEYSKQYYERLNEQRAQTSAHFLQVMVESYPNSWEAEKLFTVWGQEPDLKLLLVAGGPQRQLSVFARDHFFVEAMPDYSSDILSVVALEAVAQRLGAAPASFTIASLPLMRGSTAALTDETAPRISPGLFGEKNMPRRRSGAPL